MVARSRLLAPPPPPLSGRGQAAVKQRNAESDRAAESSSARPATLATASTTYASHAAWFSRAPRGAQQEWRGQQGFDKAEGVAQAAARRHS